MRRSRSRTVLQISKRLLAFGAVLAAAVARVHPAQACTWPSCQSPIVIPKASSVPGNLVRFEVVTAQRRDPELLTMRTSEGEPIPTRLQDIGGRLVFAPIEPIAEGTEVVVEYAMDCSFGRPPPIPPPLQTLRFTASRHEQRAYELGALEVTERGISSPGKPNSEVGFVRVQLPMHLTKGGYVEYSDLVRHEATLDGIPIRVRTPDLDLGTLDAEVDVSSWCTGPEEPQFNSCNQLEHVPVGKHTLEVTTSIVGEETPLGVSSIELDTICSYAASSVAVEEDAAACTLSPRPTRGSGLPLAATLLALAGAWSLRRSAGI
jgi:hypothetical protein